MGTLSFKVFFISLNCRYSKNLKIVETNFRLIISEICNLPAVVDLYNCICFELGFWVWICFFFKKKIRFLFHLIFILSSDLFFNIFIAFQYFIYHGPNWARGLTGAMVSQDLMLGGPACVN